MIVNGFLFSVSLVGFALSPTLSLGAVFLILAGITSTAFSTIISTFIQFSVPNELRGRMMSLYTVTLIGLPSLGALGSGSLAEWLGGVEGAPRAVMLCALVLGVLILALFPVFMRRDLPQRYIGSTSGQAPGNAGRR